MVNSTRMRPEMSGKLKELRALGIAMGSKHAGRLIGFTTDEEAAQKARDLGARVDGCYNATGPRGWEVLIPESEA
jgi:hypothetical protein